jgi:DNA replication and repair protein RecF
VQRRRALVTALAPRVEALFAAIHSDLGIRIQYRSHPTVDAAALEEQVLAALLAGLRSRRDLDQRRGFTGFGPHTDDLQLELGGHPAGDHGSQGQLRSLVLALKLAELGHLEERQGEAPLLLLDDVASELDEVRRGKLFETIAALPGQTLITVTDRDLLPRLPERRDFEVVGGQVRELP